MCPLTATGPNFNLKLLLYVTNSLLLFFAIYLTVMGNSYTKLPGPPINGAQAAVTTSIIICIITGIKLITLPLRLNQLILTIIYLILLISLFCAQVVYAVIVFTTDDTVKIRSYLKNVYNVKTINDTDRHILNIHGYFVCCGIDGMDDPDVNIKHQVYLSYGIARSTVHNATHLIRECCSNETLIICTKLDAYNGGCLEKIHKLHKESTNIIGMFFILCSIALVPVAIIGFKGLPLENQV